MNGTELITAERKRQIEKEHFTPEHDDDWAHTEGQLAIYACCLASPVPLFRLGYAHDGTRYKFQDPFPLEWDYRWDKRARLPKAPNTLIPNQDLPTDKRIRNLVKAGALIAAEIDRLQRLEKNG